MDIGGMDAKWLEQRLIDIHRRVQWIADEEARSVFVRGFAARGGLTAEKEHLIAQTEKILDRLRDDL